MYANKEFLGKLWLLSPIVVVLGIVFGLEWSYIENFLKYYWPTHQTLMILISIPFYINTLGIFANLFACAVVDPGGVHPFWSKNNLGRVRFFTQADKEAFLREHPDVAGEYSSDKLNENHQIYHYCNICKVVKPERTHHCKMCNRCILKMDHHCPWVGNCVGFRNHKLFLLFCFHASLGCFMEGFLLIPRCISVLQSRRMFAAPGALIVTIGCICGIFVGAAIGFMAVIHGIHIFNNLSTVEMHTTDSSNNPYNLQKKCDNWFMVFGKEKWSWFLPIAPRGMLTDGHRFPKRTENPAELQEIFFEQMPSQYKETL